MKQVLNGRGEIVPGLFKNDDGSFVNRDSREYYKSKKQKDNFDSLNTEVKELKAQIQQILELLQNQNK